MKTASFTVRGTQEQSNRWKRAAEAEGFPSAGAWLARAADAYLKVRAKAGLPLPLAWRHRMRFTVCLMDGREMEVRGVVSPPFAIYQGTSYGPDTNKLRTLVHIPTRKVIATLRSSRQCKALAAELAPIWIRDQERAAAVVDQHLREKA